MASYGTLVEHASKTDSSADNHNCNEEVIHAQPRPVPHKSLLVAYLLWFPLGILGIHRFYLGYTFMGVVYMFTLGYCGIGWIVDGFFMPSMVKETNSWLEYDASNPSKDHYRGCGCGEVALRYGGSCSGRSYLRQRSLRDARILVLNPFGIIGRLSINKSINVII